MAELCTCDSLHLQCWAVLPASAPLLFKHHHPQKHSGEMLLVNTVRTCITLQDMDLQSPYVSFPSGEDYRTVPPCPVALYCFLQRKALTL